jgi:hypothetical protein
MRSLCVALKTMKLSEARAVRFDRKNCASPEVSALRCGPVQHAADQDQSGKGDSAVARIREAVQCRKSLCRRSIAAHRIKNHQNHGQQAMVLSQARFHTQFSSDRLSLHRLGMWEVLAEIGTDVKHGGPVFTVIPTMILKSFCAGRCRLNLLENLSRGPHRFGDTPKMSQNEGREVVGVRIKNWMPEGNPVAIRRQINPIETA